MPIYRSSSRVGGHLVPYNLMTAAGMGYFSLSSPTSSNVLAWYEADYGVEYVSGVSAVNNQNVGRWLDQSSNARHVTNTSNNTSNPTYLTNQINGYPALNFNGASSQWLNWASNLGTTTGFTQVAVAVNTGGALGGTTTGGTNVNPIICHGNSGSGSGTGIELNLALWGNATPQWGSANDGSAGTVTLTKNGLSTTVTITQNVWSLGTIRTTAWNFASVSPAGYYLGRLPNGAATYWGTNKLAALVIYNRALTDTELLQVCQYFGTKYGLTIS